MSWFEIGVSENGTKNNQWQLIEVNYINLLAPFSFKRPRHDEMLEHYQKQYHCTRQPFQQTKNCISDTRGLSKKIAKT